VSLQRGSNEVGRALTCQVSIEGEGISKVHAVITWDDAGIVVEDKGSTNKSMLGSLEEPVELVPGQKYPMEHGDVVVFGDVACVFLWRPAAGGYGATRSIHTAPPDMSSKSCEGTMQSPVRLHTTAFQGDLSQQEILGQLDTLMEGMKSLYSIVQGNPQSPAHTHSSYAFTRPSTHVSGVSSYGTRAQTAADGSIGMIDQSSVSFALDRSDLPEYSPWRQSQPNITINASKAAGFSGFDRAGANLQGTAAHSTQPMPSTAADAPLPGLYRSAPLAPPGPELAPADFMHLYAGVSRGGTTAGTRPQTQQRPLTSISTSPPVSHEMVLQPHTPCLTPHLCAHEARPSVLDTKSLCSYDRGCALYS
jgi:hypothetical protein